MKKHQPAPDRRRDGERRQLWPHVGEPAAREAFGVYGKRHPDFSKVCEIQVDLLQKSIQRQKSQSQAQF